jgi:hypothetical protein
MSVLETKVVNIHYTFSNNTGLDHAPFEVPKEVINNTTPLSTSEILSNFVKVELDDQNVIKISVFMKNGQQT